MAESPSSSDEIPGPVPETTPPAEPSRPAVGAALGRSSRRLPLPAALVAGVLAAGLSWGAGEAAVGKFDVETLADPEAGPLGGLVDKDIIRGGKVREAAFVYGVQGALLGLLLGIAGGMASGSARRAAIGGFVGMVIGAALAASASMGLFMAYLKGVDSVSDDLIKPMLTHGAVWSLVGGAGGLAFGLGLGGGRASIVRATIGGLVGAVLGTVLYEVGGAILFPLAKTTDPLAETGPARLFAQAATCVLAALGAAMTVEPSKPPASPIP